MTARLHHERVIASGATPSRWLLMTHGIYGSGANWRSIARKIVERRREWGAVLVDLRGHGRSEHGAPPHTVAACVHDLRACIDELARDGARIDVVSGHSFGGKVVLAARATAGTERDAAGPGGAGFAQVWVLDSSPSTRLGLWERPDYDVRQVWEAMRELPKTWARRDDFVEAIVARGHTRALAQWLAMNLHPTAAGAAGPQDSLRLALDLEQVEAMIRDYASIDLWSAVEDERLPGETIHVIGERSSTVSASDRERLAAEPVARRVRMHVIAGAGHWLNLDAPAAVVELFVGALPAGERAGEPASERAGEPAGE